MTTGLDLSRRFYDTLVAPIIARAAPTLPHGAARIGDGSEVLGFDTEMSADHNYGPIVQIFPEPAAFAGGSTDRLMAALDRDLPTEFEGWTVRFPSVGRSIRTGNWHTSDHGVELTTLEALTRRQLGVGLDPIDDAGWLAFPQQRLLTLTAGAVFRDDGGQLTDLRRRLAYFPRDIWLLRLAAQWDRIGEERAFVGRTGLVGDEIGSRLIVARLVEGLMQLAFLVERRYAPYPKWFGTGFSRLGIAAELQPLFDEALTSNDWQRREAAIASAATRLATLQLERKIPGAVEPRVAGFFTRPFQVINADEIAAGFRAAIDDEALRNHVVGTIDQVTDLVPVLTQPRLANRITSALLETDIPST